MCRFIIGIIFISTYKLMRIPEIFNQDTPWSQLHIQNAQMLHVVPRVSLIDREVSLYVTVEVHSYSKGVIMLSLLSMFKLSVNDK